MSCIDLWRLHYKCRWIVCIWVCNYSCRITVMNTVSPPELEKSPLVLGARSKPPVVLSVTHFDFCCCANGFYDPGLFSSSPPLLHLQPIISLVFFTALLLGGELSVFLCFLVSNFHPWEKWIPWIGALTGNLRAHWLDLSAGVRKIKMNGCAACGRPTSPARQACVGAIMEHTLEYRSRARNSMSMWSHARTPKVHAHIHWLIRRHRSTQAQQSPPWGCSRLICWLQVIRYT